MLPRDVFRESYLSGMSRVRELLRRLRLGSLQRSDFTSASERPVENEDALAAARAREAQDNPFSAGANYPPGYVKSYDEGRPRH